ncbi:MAG: hypothetical protein LC754_14410 [Acidobacteria bacterium]|nr:hypothetical protein [Acidobacteriota bacterium]
MDGAQPAKAVFADACTLQVRPLDAPRVADDDELDVAFAVNQRADLPARLVREFGYLAREFRRDDLLWRDAARVKLFDAAELVGL